MQSYYVDRPLQSDAEVNFADALEYIRYNFDGELKINYVDSRWVLNYANYTFVKLDLEKAIIEFVKLLKSIEDAKNAE